MARQIDSVWGLEFASDALCLAQFVPEQRQVVNISIQPIEEHRGESWDAVTPLLKQLVRAVKLGGENVICSLPGEHAVIRKLCLDVDEENRDEALEWEFCQHIIGSRDEYSFDFEKLPVAPKAGLDQYLVVGYRTETIERVSRLLRVNKLNPLVVDLDIFALVNVYEANYSEDDVAAPALLVLASDTTSKCVLAAGGTYQDIEIVDHRNLLQNIDAYAGAIENAAAKILACNPGLPGRESIPVLFCGSLFAEKEFAVEVKATIHNSDLLLPFRKISCGAEIGEKDLKKYSPQLAVAVGLALRGAEQSSQ